MPGDGNLALCPVCPRCASWDCCTWDCRSLASAPLPPTVIVPLLASLDGYLTLAQRWRRASGVCGAPRLVRTCLPSTAINPSQARLLLCPEKTNARRSAVTNAAVTTKARPQRQATTTTTTTRRLPATGLGNIDDETFTSTPLCLGLLLSSSSGVPATKQPWSTVRRSITKSINHQAKLSTFRFLDNPSTHSPNTPRLWAPIHATPAPPPPRTLPDPNKHTDSPCKQTR